MIVGSAVDTVTSAAWSSADPRVSVVVATHDRAGFLPELLAALESQQHPAFEVVVVDDGSTDGTWQALRDLAGSTALALQAVRIEATGGPSVPRNTAAARARAALLAITDDDCLPEPGWLEALELAVEHRVAVQGCTVPTDEPHGPWDRSIEVRSLSGLWETCNLAVRRDAFHAAGGFPVLDLLGPGGRGFGEDLALGAALARTGEVGFADYAVVRHRWLPGTFRDHLASRRRLRGFPALLAVAPELRDRLARGAFLSRRTALVDIGLVGAAAAAVTRRPALLLAALPWVAHAWEDAHHKRVPLPRVLLADVVAAVSLAEGSVRSGRPVL